MYVQDVTAKPKPSNLFHKVAPVCRMRTFFALTTVVAFAAQVQVGAAEECVTSQKKYDYIVVGSGAGGCGFIHEMIKNNQIQENGSILLLEAGDNELSVLGGQSREYGWDNAGISRWEIPGEYGAIPWSANSTEYSHWGDTFGWLPKVIGGATSMNGALSMVPPQSDFETWPSPWTWDGMKDIYHDLYADLTITDKPSKDGKHYSKLNKFMFDVFENAGFTKESFTKASAVGVNTYGRPAVQAKDGRRQSVCTLLADVIKQNTTVHTLVKHKVSSVILSDSGDLNLRGDNLVTALGVTVQGSDGKSTHKCLNPNGKVILAAGALNTPKILHQSGIGKDMRVNNTQVGAKLTDHTMLRLLFHKANQKTWSPEMAISAGKDLENPDLREYLTNQTGFYSQYGPTGVAYLKIGNAPSNDPNIEVFWLNGGEGGPETFAVYVQLLKPKSKSAVDINGKYPVSFNDLYYGKDDSEDVVALKSAAEHVIKAVVTNTGTQGQATLIEPRTSPEADDFSTKLSDFVLNGGPSKTRMIANHFASTCPLGTCVDAKDASVRGTQNLHIADMSLVPEQVACHPVMTAYAVGVKVAKLIG